MENIKNDLTVIGTKRADTLAVGDYVKMPIFTREMNIYTSDLKWVVASNNGSSVTLVSDNIVYLSNKYYDIAALKAELEKFYNLYITDITYLTKTQVDAFWGNVDPTIKSALLGEEVEFMYYNNTTSKFNLCTYKPAEPAKCDSSNAATEIDPESTTIYGVRPLITISIKTPIQSGSGSLSDPYNVEYYKHGSPLRLHYDSKNNTGNLGNLDGINYIKDLSGNNINGIAYSNYNLSENAISITGTNYIDTALNIYDVFNSPEGYTIEFRAKNYMKLSMGATSISLHNNQDLYLGTNPYLTGLDVNKFNTITIVKKPGVAKNEVYTNGSLTPIDGTTLSFSSGSILIVGNFANNQLVKSIRVYNKALNANEIYNNWVVDTRWLES